MATAKKGVCLSFTHSQLKVLISFAADLRLNRQIGHKSNVNFFFSGGKETHFLCHLSHAVYTAPLLNI